VSSFFKRFFGRSKIEQIPRRPSDVPLPPAPDPDALFDWSPRAKPEESRREPTEASYKASERAHQAPSGMPAAPISEALSQFGMAPAEPAARPPLSAADPSTSGPASTPSPPPSPKSMPAQIRLLMADGTVLEFSGDPELEHRIAYLAENLFVPARSANEPGEQVSAETPGLPGRRTEAEAEAESQPDAARPPVENSADAWRPFDGTATALEIHGPLWPQVRLVFADGTEAALPRDQEIIDRVSYVIGNLLPARHPA
jgi:hypothetical protein